VAEHFLGKEKVVGSILTIGSEQNKNNNMAKKKKRSKLVCQKCKKTSYFTNKTKEELKKLWETMKEKAFLSYKVDIQTVDKNAKDFEDLSIEDQKRFLLECLDKNHLYVNYSEIDDEEDGLIAYAIPE
jgi:hypothetical protein